MRAQTGIKKAMYSGRAWLTAIILLGASACCGPKPDDVTPQELTQEEKTQITVVRDQLGAAERKGTWEDADHAKFFQNLASLPPGPRLELAKDLVVRLNTGKLKVVHKAPKPGRVVCPAFCDRGVKDGNPVPVPVPVPRTNTTGKVDAK